MATLDSPVSEPQVDDDSTNNKKRDVYLDESTTDVSSISSLSDCTKDYSIQDNNMTQKGMLYGGMDDSEDSEPPPLPMFLSIGKEEVTQPVTVSFFGIPSESEESIAAEDSKNSKNSKNSKDSKNSKSKSQADSKKTPKTGSGRNKVGTLTIKKTDLYFVDGSASEDEVNQDQPQSKKDRTTSESKGSKSEKKHEKNGAKSSQPTGKQQDGDMGRSSGACTPVYTAILCCSSSENKNGDEDTSDAGSIDTNDFKGSSQKYGNHSDKGNGPGKSVPAKDEDDAPSGHTFSFVKISAGGEDEIEEQNDYGSQYGASGSMSTNGYMDDNRMKNSHTNSSENLEANNNHSSSNNYLFDKTNDMIAKLSKMLNDIEAACGNSLPDKPNHMQQYMSGAKSNDSITDED